MTTVNNYINGEVVPPSTNEYLDIINPSDSTILGKVAISNSTDVNAAVIAANDAFSKWSNMTVKSRAALMLKFHALVRKNATELGKLIVLENGKNMTGKSGLFRSLGDLSASFGLMYRYLIVFANHMY